MSKTDNINFTDQNPNKNYLENFGNRVLSDLKAVNNSLFDQLDGLDFQAEKLVKYIVLFLDREYLSQENIYLDKRLSQLDRYLAQLEPMLKLIGNSNVVESELGKENKSLNSLLDILEGQYTELVANINNFIESEIESEMGSQSLPEQGLSLNNNKDNLDANNSGNLNNANPEKTFQPSDSLRLSNMNQQMAR